MRKHSYERRRKESLWSRYGVTIADYNNMLERQGGRCALCSYIPTNKPLHVDHKHVEGYAKLSPKEKRKYVRGLLCAGCNRLVAAFDRAGFYERARRYLNQ